MKHLGNICDIDWSKVEPVDVVTGGSPCQDLSVAGKRAGLAGERSGLFMEQIRCVKELRQADVQRGRTGIAIRPRFMAWENVPGAFSSGKPKGADFAAVIEEIIKVAEPGAVVHVCVPDRGWNKSGCYYAEDGSWSIAWRVHDAQFWGVPQRRKRISLVADFGGLAAPEVSFERKGLSGYFEPSGTEREGTARASERSTVICLQGNGIDRAETAGCNGKGWREDVSYTLNTIERPAVCAAFSAGQGEKAGGIGWQEECSPSLKAANSGTNMTPTVFDARGNGDGNTVCTLTGDHQNRVTDYTALVSTYQDVTGPLMANSHPGSYCGQDAYQDMLIASVGALRARDYKGVGSQYVTEGKCIPQDNVVRRLTPLECERLQGYPDGWTDIGEWVDSKGKRHKEADSPRYKALGNSIALPFWCWLAKRISSQYERDITIGSLFDGIGGFPYAFEKCGGKAVWASEIEEFPIAVTKLRFGEE